MAVGNAAHPSLHIHPRMHGQNETVGRNIYMYKRTCEHTYIYYVKNVQLEKNMHVSNICHVSSEHIQTLWVLDSQTKLINGISQ